MRNTYYKSLRQEIMKHGLLIRRTELESGEELVVDTSGRVLATTGGFDAKGEVLEEKIALKANLVFIGSGHVAKALYEISRLLDLDITVIDEREEMLNEERFPQARRMLMPYSRAFEKKLDIENPYFVIFTHGHEHDQEALEYALSHEAGYIGMIGSRAKVAHTYDNLRKKGFTDEDFGRVHSPIGLEINAATPSEIATSIAAEIISTYRKDRKQVFLEPGMLEYLAGKDEEAILVRIVRKKGSGPREEGCMMAVTSDEIVQTIGGGAIERESIRIARKMLENGDSYRLEHFKLSSESDLGMVCGGNADLLFTRV